MCTRALFLTFKRISFPSISRSPFSYVPSQSVSRVQVRHVLTSLPSPPLEFPTSGFEKLEDTWVYDEEDIPGYSAADYYPVRLGEVFHSRYQIVAKLGYGPYSTTWLCRDLCSTGYVTIKVRTAGSDHPPKDRETDVLARLKTGTGHAGENTIRRPLGTFQLSGYEGRSHECWIFRPRGMSFSELAGKFDGRRVPKQLVQMAAPQILQGVDYLAQNGVVHTDLHEHNILIGLTADEEKAVWPAIEREELDSPSPRKVVNEGDEHGEDNEFDGRVIHTCHDMPITHGEVTVCGLGQARFGSKGEKYTGNVTLSTATCRPPEVILRMKWDAAVDVWTLGILFWSLLEGEYLFGWKNRGEDDEKHLAEMVALLGPPPLEFLKRSSQCSEYWDSQGNWKGSFPIPEESFEARMQSLEGEEKAAFVRLMRKILHWMPEERPSLTDISLDEFFRQPWEDAASKTDREVDV